MAYTNRAYSEKKDRFLGATVVCREAPDMATPNRGSVMPQGGTAKEQGPGVAGRKAFQHPADFTPGPNCDVGLGEGPANDWDGDFDE